MQHVTIKPVHQEKPVPGILLAWRQGRHGWEGLTLYATEDYAHGGSPHVHISWLPADFLRPYPGSGPPRPST